MKKIFRNIERIAMLFIMVASIFGVFAACRTGKKFVDYPGKWESDKLSFEISVSGEHVVPGIMDINGKQVEVALLIRTYCYSIEIAKLSDIDLDKGAESFYSCDELYLLHFEHKKNIFDKKIDKITVKIDTDYYSETVGQESRVGETWVLTRKDLS